MHTKSPLGGTADQRPDRTIKSLTAVGLTLIMTMISTQTKVSTNKSGARKSRPLEVEQKLSCKMKSLKTSRNKSQVVIAEFVATHLRVLSRRVQIINHYTKISM